jgi:hypothetical protein
MTPRTARPIPVAQPVNVTVAVSTGTPAAPPAPVAQATRPAGNGLAATAAQVIGVIGQVLANGRPRPVPVAQPVGGMVTGGVVGLPVVATPVMPVAVAMPVMAAPLVPVGNAPQPQPYPTPSFPPVPQTPTDPRMRHAPTHTEHHGDGGGDDWDTAGAHDHTPHAREHHDQPPTDEHEDPVHESEPADCGGPMEDVQPDVTDECEPTVEDLQPDEGEPAVEAVQPDEPECEPVLDGCDPTVEDVQPEWDECELPADEGESAVDDCVGAMPDDGGCGWDNSSDLIDGTDVGFDLSGGSDWGGSGEYC